jgi:hypothetical protein
MRTHMTLIWHTAGLLSLVFVVHFWLLAVNPWKLGWHYPGEASGFLLATVLALTLSILAAVRGSRYWYAATTAVVITLVAVMFQMH